MRGELDFQKYSQPLGEGLFADNVILSILDYRENRNIDAEERAALERARTFFGDVINGGSLQSKKLSSVDDLKAAKAFNSAVSIRPGLSRSQSFVDYIRELRGTVEDILNGIEVSEQKIDKIDDFFSSYSRINFQKSDSVLETV